MNGCGHASGHLFVRRVAVFLPLPQGGGTPAEIIGLSSHTLFFSSSFFLYCTPNEYDPRHEVPLEMTPKVDCATSGVLIYNLRTDNHAQSMGVGGTNPFS